ncbi:LysR family transcriptional regulator [Natronospirillum operosum]|uniref:LysR family transcriptional regulator n=1 Tax=Natronospirillum operosum TaxID=2759953 RepID=A0A4Z0WIS3_9GAMM|nr:LysR substrate-binding domain-containing protein [Natronospirillum operosum]TGG95035.1 LysR family transcriptional regulator [Natronospirillum operosum]
MKERQELDRLPHITLRQVEAFRAVMHTQSMTSAAQMLSITQPAVSRLIADLEASLDLRLFERNGPKLKPTDNALRLMEEVQRVFLGLHQIEQAARTIKRFPQTLLRIAAPPFLSLGFVSMVVGALRRQYPEMRFSIHTDNSLAIADQVARGQHDLGFCTLPSGTSDVNVIHESSVDAVCLLPRDHALASSKIIYVEQLENEPLIVLGQSGSIRPQINDVFSNAKISLNVTAEILFAATAGSLVEQNVGLALMDPFSARATQTARTVVRPFKPRVKLSFSMIAPHHLKLAEPIRYATKVLHEEIEPMLQNWAFRDLSSP